VVVATLSLLHAMTSNNPSALRIRPC
jgi:hypothetical protein